MPELIAAMLVKDEQGRWLERTLGQLGRMVDAIVVVDDASTDGSFEICRSWPKTVVYREPQTRFDRDEPGLRRHLWERAKDLDAEWVLMVDADEEFEPRAERELRAHLRQRDYDAVAFRIFDLWKSETHVRVDGAWNPWNRFTTMIARPQLGFADDWLQRSAHSGRFPLAYRDVPVYYSHLRVRHRGWSRAGDHLRKYLYYRERDIENLGHVHPHTESILNPRIALEPWIDQPAVPWLGRD